MELVREKKQKRKKRGREGENKKEMDVTTNSKKLQSKHCTNDVNNNSIVFGNSNEINYNDDEVGVFDFPWLKEGSTFQANECLDLEDINMNPFLTYPNACAWPPTLDPFCPQTTLHEDDHSDLWSFQAEDEIKPLDCIWHSVFDQPLDLNLNKI